MQGPDRRRRAARHDRGELPDEVLELVVGGLSPELARLRYEYLEAYYRTGEFPIGDYLREPHWRR